MSAATATTARAATARRPRTGGVRWVVWRQNRTALLALLALALAGAAALLALGYLHNSDGEHLERCNRGLSGGCAGLGDHILLEHHAIQGLLYLLVPAPVVVGALLGAGSLAADIESGRVGLLFTQSVRPAQWLRHRIAVPLAAVLLVAAVVGAAATWVESWNARRNPMDGLPDWFAVLDFWGTLPALFAVTAFTFTLGVVVALLVRRVLPAVGVTAALTVLAVGAVHALRPRLWPAVYVNGQLHFATTRDAWIIGGGVVDHGRRLPMTACYDPAHRAACEAGASWTAYHPPSHHWPIQLIASALLLLPALAFLGAAFPALHRLSPAGRRR